MRKIQGFNRTCLIFLVGFLVLGMPGAWSAERKPFDHSALDRFLKKYVDEKGAFDFRTAKQDPALLEEYLGQIENVNLIELVIWPREEKLAFWLNAYHAGLLKAILDHYPIRSVHDIPGIWEVPLVLIGGRRFSLNAIQTQQLIDVFRDEKIHCALACSGKSCPPFQTEAFTGPRVEGQLFMATRRFVNDERYNKIVPGKNKIWLSHIFRWYAADFTLDFGRAENMLELSDKDAAVLSFIAYYLEDIEKVEFLERGKYKIKYSSFDWTLNETVQQPAT